LINDYTSISLNDGSKIFSLKNWDRISEFRGEGWLVAVNAEVSPEAASRE
jgi:hypothetical protein